MELLTLYSEQILIGIFATINILSFFVMAHDKRKAVRGNTKKRSPEGFLFFMATMFGSIGVYAGMQVFRHKTRKWYFQLGIPLLIIQNVVVVYLMRELFIL